ncbi:MAG TPA: hypothetical protein DCZ76_11515 [Treponema sp.]|nr:hypothetical protein [Treponema sp.]
MMDVLFSWPFDRPLEAALRVPGTGRVWGNRGWQIEARQGLEGRAQPVPAGVRSATRGMEPKGGTPESPHKWPPCHFFARILHGPSRASGTEF